jgi:putative Holliday junction resolvase
MQKGKEMFRILAIDFGERRIGLAISDPTLTIATPLRIIDTERENPVDAIRVICEEKNVKRIIMGLPLLLSGKEGRMAKLVRDFKEKLESKIGIEVILVDERFTSKISEREIRKRGRISSKDKEKIDLYAAAYLLQEYLTKMQDSD